MRRGPAPSRPQRVGDYLLERLIGVGGMGEVFVALREGPHGFQKRVALKRILPQLAHDPRLVAMFCDEARIQAALSHPNLIEVFDFGEDQGQPFIALELVDGLSVAELITNVAARKQTVDLAAALYIVREVLQALGYVHGACDDEGRTLGIVHRDIAPSNILVGRMGQVKLGDFGIVRSTAIDARTVPGELKGKIGYVSPEQALGMPLDGRSDLFSLMIVFAEMLICRSLFVGENELEVLQNLHRGNLERLRRDGAHIPMEVRAILMKGLSRWPEQRHRSAAELLQVVELAARRLGVTLGAHVLADWLRDLGILAVSSEVQQKAAPSVRSPRPASEEFIDSVTLAPGESEPPPPAALDAILELCPGNDQGVPEELAHAVSAPGEVSYRIQRPGGAVMGPFPLARVLEMLATGRLSVDAAVSRNGGAFLPALSMLELGRMLQRPAYRFHEPLALYTKEHWPVRLETVPEVVFDVARRERSGLLCARRGSQQVRIWFERGAPAFSSSTDSRELLGASLLESDGLRQEDVDAAVERAWRSGEPLGRVLVARGICSAERVDAALREQLWSRLVSLFRFRVGELAFVQGVTHGESSLLFSAPFAFLSSALLAAYAPEEVASLVEVVERSGVVRAAEPPRDRVLGLAPEEQAALALAKRGTPLRVLMQEGVRTGRFDPRAARRAVLVGLTAGVLTWKP